MGWKTVDIEHGKELRDVQASPEEADLISYRQLIGQHLQPFAFLPFSDQDETGVGDGGSQTRERPEQQIMVLLGAKTPDETDHPSISLNAEFAPLRRAMLVLAEAIDVHAVVDHP